MSDAERVRKSIGKDEVALGAFGRILRYTDDLQSRLAAAEKIVEELVEAVWQYEEGR